MIFLLIQLCCYFCGIAFSAGGGNYPGLESSNFVFLKVFLIAIPIGYLGFQLLLKPLTVMKSIGLVIDYNKTLLAYFSIAFVTLAFSVNFLYCFTRLVYSFFCFISLIAILIQYYLSQSNKIETLKKHLNYLTGFTLLLPLYVFTKSGFTLNNFRFSLEGLYLIHPNILASLYAHLLLWHSMNFIYQNSNRKIHFLFIFLLTIVEILLFSRTALIALIIAYSALPFIELVFKKTCEALIISISVLLFYALLATLLLTNVISLDKLVSLVTRHDDITSLMTFTNRTILWKELFDNLTVKSFFVGYGYSVIDKNFGIDFGTGILYGAHNGYLSVLLGSGIFALMFMVLFLCRKLVFFLKNKQTFPKEIQYSIILSFILFAISCCFSEEIGVSMSVTFSYLVFLTTFATILGRQK